MIMAAKISPVEITGLPTPMVTTVDAPRSRLVAPCVAAAAPPPAMIASDHFNIGGASPSAKAVTPMPAALATGAAMTDEAVSRIGTYKAAISTTAATAIMTSAAVEPTHSEPEVAVI